MPIDFNLLKTLSGHGYDVNSVAISRDCKLVVTGGGDKTIRIWDVVSYANILSAEHGEWINAVCFAPSGQAIASGARDGSVKLWNTENGQVLGTIQAHATNVSSVAFSPDGSRIATSGGDGHIRAFNLKEKKLERDITAHTGWVWCVAFSTLGDKIVSSGSDKIARIWSAETGQLLVQLEGHTDDVLSCAFSPDDRFVATTGKNGGLLLWEAETGRQLFRVKSHEGAANCVSFSPDGLHMATAGADHLINVWSVESSEKVRELSGHQDYVSAVVFARDGKFMVSSGGDGTLKIWQVTDKSAYAAAATFRDPDLEIEHEDAANRAEGYSSVYASGKVIAETALKNGTKVTLMQTARDKFTVGIGEMQRTAVSIADDQVNIISGNAALLLKYDLASNSIVYDRTEGSSAPWEGDRDLLSKVASDPGLETFRMADIGDALKDEFEFERASTPVDARYQSFDKLGKLLAKAQISKVGHSLRMVKFDDDTVYILFNQMEEPTIVLRGDNLDVRDATGKGVFRLGLRTLEPVTSRKTHGTSFDGDAGDVDLESLLAGSDQLLGDDEIQLMGDAPGMPGGAGRDPLLVHGLSEMQDNAPKVNRILEKAIWQKASDIHIPSATPVLLRRHGVLVPIGGKAFSPPEIEMMAEEILTPEQFEAFDESGELDFSYQIPNVARFRGNICRQHRGVDLSFRVIPETIPAPDVLGLPPAVIPLTKNHNGLVLITGPAGQGKSTTIAALVDIINAERPQHIITVEDPIEFVYPLRRAVVNQREVGRHTLSFANALRASLREDPDVIVVGEMRDLETIALAITASETGHLVFGSLMTSSAPQTIDRILDSFPSAQQAQIRIMLSESLRGIVSQQLVPTADGEGRVLACEVLLGTQAVGNLIREKKTFQLPSILQTSRNIGMQRMDDSLFDLAQAGRISPEHAMRYAQDPKALEGRLKPKGPEPVTQNRSR